MTSGGGRFDFDDGGTYCGGWEDGKAHGHGVCTGPKGQGEYSGAWQCGFEVSGVYTWPSGNSYTGQWFQGKRHGLGVEGKGRWVYRGEWTQGFKGRYGVRKSTSSGARYEGTWTTGLQDGYGCETYADGGTYQGQWQRGTRHGYGVRQSVPYGLASHYRPKALRASLTSLRSENEDEQVVKNRDRKLDESRGGFVLKARSDETPTQPRRSIFDKQGKYSLRKTLMSGLKLKKQKSTGDINDSPKRQSGSVRSTISNISHVSADSTQSGMTNTSMYTDSNLSFVSQDDITDINVTESYMGEWKNDKRSGFGISERSDGLKYEGEWYNNKKYGYGVTTFKDGAREEGKYKNNILISSGKKNKLFLIRTSKLRERVDNALVSAQRAAQIALQKADIAITRMANARSKSEQADHAASMAGQDSDIARMKAKEYAPEFIQPGTDFLNKKLQEHPEDNEYCHMKILPNNHSAHQRSKPMLGHQSPDGLMESSHIGLTSGLDSTLPGSYNPGMPDGMNYLNDAYPHTQLSATRNTEKTSISTTQPSRSPSLKIRRYSFLAGSRRGRGFSELFNSTILNDHFDQYCSAVKDDSLGRDLLNTASPHQQQQHHHHHHQQLKQQQQQQQQQQPQQQQRNCGPASDTSPDSGVSETMEEDSKHRPLQRRRTLPCIIKRDEEAETEKLHLKETKAAVSSENLAAKNPETIVIENGIRKRIKTETNRQNHAESGVPIKSYTIESQKNLSKVCNPGSLPDINIIKTHSLMKPMPREEAYKLSSQRREEIRHLQEIDERRKQGDMAVILGDVKDWCQQRQLLVLLVALNVSLATMFFNLLS